MSKYGKKVFVGLSGGVDSSVSAALLKDAGYDVTGVFIRVWQPDFLPCSWREERRDAMRVAAKLGIPFLTFNLEKEYKKEVVDYMIREYKAGRVPNPDVMCNKYVKFGAFYDKAREMGANFVATGHYARIIDGKLTTASDSAKDQSYFLWTLTPEIIKHTFFPIGGYKKEEVRKLAKKFGLFTSVKKDSQGLCFIGRLDMKEFLSHYIKPKKGSVLNNKGEVIGTHNGAVFFALGERHGFTITKKSPDNLAMFVTDKDVKKNTITVGNKKEFEEKTGDRKDILISSANWSSGLVPETGKKYYICPRYHSEKVPFVFKKISGKSAEISVRGSKESFVPGQSAVFYDSEICLGGGIIE